MIYYLSITGNIKRFTEKLGEEYTCQSITDPDLILEGNSVFIFPTIRFGQPPQQAVDFLEKNSQYIVGLIGSGNRNWGAFYCAGVDKMSEVYGIPVLMKFELQGTNETVREFKEKFYALSRTE